MPSQEALVKYKATLLDITTTYEEPGGRERAALDAAIAVEREAWTQEILKLTEDRFVKGDLPEKIVASIHSNGRKRLDEMIEDFWRRAQMRSDNPTLDTREVGYLSALEAVKNKLFPGDSDD